MFLIPADTPPSTRARFEQEALPHFEAIRRVARRLTNSSSEAQDLAQETFLRALKGFESYMPGTQAKAWLFSVMYSVFNNNYRKRQRTIGEISLDEIEHRYQRVVDPADVEALRSLEQSIDQEWIGSEGEQALARLPESFRSAVLLIDIEELSYDEASRALKCPVGTVRSRLFRGRKALALELADLARRRGFRVGTRSER